MSNETTVEYLQYVMKVPMTIQYSAYHVWYPSPSERRSYAVSDCDTLEEAHKMLRSGVTNAPDYTRPRWWQYWRWKENPLP